MRNITFLGACLAFAAGVQLATPTTAQAQATKAAARPEVGQLPEVYTFEGSKLTVTVVRYGPRASKQALVEIADLDHPWNQRIFRTSVQDVSRRAGKVENSYSIQLDGKPWGLVIILLDGSGLALNLRENGDTGKNVRYPLYYSKENTENTVSEYLLTAYLKQEANPKTSTARYNGKPAAK
jgi:hypothetical protein